MKYVQESLHRDTHISKGEAPDLCPSYEARMSLGNYKKAEALALATPDSSERARSFISRGAFKEAQEAVNNFKEHIESKFEEARIRCYSGDFTTALSLIEQCFQAADLSLISRMTAHQIKALCLYELGQYIDASREVDRVMALESLFPHAEASLFARTTLARCLACLGSFDLAEQHRQEVWSRIEAQTYALNMNFQLIMYLRMDCEIRRKKKENFYLQALAGLWISRNLGSPIHEGLFILELSQAPNTDIRRRAQQDLNYYIQKYSCIAYYATQRTHSEDMNENVIPVDSYGNSPNQILFLDHKCRYDMTTSSIEKVNLRGQSLDILKVIGNTSMNKESLFLKVWGYSSYHPLENDTAIRTAIKRLRKQVGVQIITEGSMLSCPELLMVTDI